MTRVHIICEGQTEETFVKELLIPHFETMKIYLFPSLIGKPGHKGGGINFTRLLTDARIRLLGDKTAFCTTFFDFYGLPSAFPGKSATATKTSIIDKASCIRTEMVKELTTHIGNSAMQRFIPYVQMYEYEGLLFSECTKFAQGVEQPALATAFHSIRSTVQSPEEINDNPHTAPSKRIKNLMPEYEKPIYGALAALEIGLPTIRRECKLFDAWLTELEGLKL